MKKNIIYIFLAIIIFSGSGCGNLSQTTPVTPEEIDAPHFFAATKTSLEVYRNGKTYEILIGYDMGRAPFYATPVGEIPKVWSENYADGAGIEVSSDFDNDGEREIIVSKFSCGTYCVSWLLAYKYDSLNDNYFLVDELSARLSNSTDINNDGVYEFLLYDGFCFRWCTHAMEASALTILKFDGNRFSDITSEFPDLIQEDAARLLQLSKGNRQDAEIALAGYLFNMYRLGKLDEGRKVFNEVCITAIKTNNCEGFRLDVEKSILGYKFRQ